MWRLWKYEIQKITGKKMFWYLTLLLLLGNVCLMGYMQQRTEDAGEETEQQEEYIDSYKAFLEEMESRSQAMLQAGGFVKKGTYSYKNIIKTNEDYKKLAQQNLKLQTGNIKGMLLLSDYTGGAVFGFIFVVICVYFLLLSERDLQLLCMIKSCRLGRIHTIITKFFVMLLMCFGYGSIQTILEVAFAGKRLGYGDLTRNIQSMELYRDCVRNITIKQFLMETVVYRGILLMLMGAFLLFLATIIRNMFTMLTVWFGYLFIEYIAFQKLTVSSTWQIFHCINPWYYWKESKVWGEYVNLNLFGNAVSRDSVAFVGYGILMLLFCCMTTLWFSNTYQRKAENRLEEIIRSIRDRIGCIPKTVSILYYEFYKVMFQQKKIILLILLACISGIFLENVLTERYYNDQATATYHSYLKSIHGKINEDTLEYISQQEKTIEELSQELSEIIGAKSGKDYIRKMEILQELESKQDGFQLVKEQLEVLENKPGNITEKYLLDEKAYGDIWNNYGKDLFYWDLQALVIICIVAGIMCEDSKSRMEQLIHTTSKGRKCLAMKKIQLSSLVTIGIYLMVQLPCLLEFYQIDGFTTCQQKMRDMTKWSMDSQVTLGMVLVVLFTLRFCLALLVCFGTIGIVRAVKKEVIGIILMAGMVQLCVILMLVFQKNISILLLQFC